MQTSSIEPDLGVLKEPVTPSKWSPPGIIGDLYSRRVLLLRNFLPLCFSPLASSYEEVPRNVAEEIIQKPGGAVTR